ncbi:MAG TPA: glycoside hydrolase family 76 protein [Candidatus Limnocylindrales bacterium]|nr:glycoside hydrolase family 76 protein [Candidatus Limnocylindrales bacterium]
MYIHYMFCPSVRRVDPAQALRLTCCLLFIGSFQTFAAVATNSVYYRAAQRTHNFVAENLLVSPAYRINPGSNTVYEWYSVSQIYADAAMVQCGDARYLAFMNDAYAWMTNLWDGTNPLGGYFSAGNIDGTGKGGGKYVDDNALTGNVYLDCYDASSRAARSNYLHSAIAIADWLMSSGQWDNTYGGGFWWSDSKTVKPTQSNGLALQLFLRLYALTGRTAYRDWANSVKRWLETQMYDPSDGLYLWQIETNGFKNPIKFTYDNAIMMEVGLLYSQVMSNSSYLGKVQTLASNLNAKLWDKTYKAYHFNSADARVNPCWCGWASQSLTRLYEADRNPVWLDYAQQNIDYLNDHLRNRTNGGYFAFCNMDGSNVDSRLEGVDQAWMQRIQALIANYR